LNDGSFVTERIRALLIESGVWFEEFSHAPARTSEEAAHARPGYTLAQGTKALVVRVTQQGAVSYVMLVVPGNCRFSSKKARQALKVWDIRFASEADVVRITGGVKPGGVPPWGSLFGIPVYVDTHVFDNEIIIFSAGNQTISIAMRAEDYRNFVNPIVCDLV
jgi:Ala-tRNA(Pro) deacylase